MDYPNVVVLENTKEIIYTNSKNSSPLPNGNSDIPVGWTVENA